MKNRIIIALLTILLVICTNATAAVVTRSNTEGFTGLSSDTKPASTFEGSSFFESDTGLTHIFAGGGWKLKTADVSFSINEILAGRAFLASHQFVAVADAASVELLIQVPAAENILGAISVSSTGAAEIDIFEDTTFSAAGTTVTPQNKNRELAATTSDTTITHTPTTTGDGTQLGTTIIAGSSSTLPNSTSIGNITETSGYVLATSTVYMIRATNTSGGAADLTINLLYIERAL